MKNVDNRAAISLAKLEKHGPEQNWSSNERSAWSRFILSLLNRMPDDVAAMKAFSELNMTVPDSEFDKRYAAVRQDSDPEILKQWLEKKDPYLAGNLGFRLLMRVMNHEDIGKDLNNLNWFIVETSKAEYEFLTAYWSTSALCGY